MYKPLGVYDIRLESPFFNREVANIMTRIPYESSRFMLIKPELDMHILDAKGRTVLGSLDGISKEKAQDGSGISRVFKPLYNQEGLVITFAELHGVLKSSYLN